MSWSHIVGHRQVIERFRRGFARDRLGSAYLFVGSRGIGKRLFARQLAQTLFCEHLEAETFDACGQCSACRLVAAGTHPDLLEVQKHDDKSVFTIDLVVGAEDDPTAVGLCRNINLRPQLANRKIAIVDDADVFNLESANALLKTLEEPPPRAILILIGTSRERQLRTIQSRCQVVPFAPLTTADVASVLARLPDVGHEVEWDELAAAAQGSVAVALTLSDRSVFDFRRDWLHRLGSLDPWADGGVNQVIQFSESAEKESGTRRERLLLVGEWSLAFYEGLLRRLAHRDHDCADTALRAAVSRGASLWSGPWSALIDSIERTVEFQTQIPTNVGAANAVEDWLVDLARLAKSPQPV